ncbi:MAG: DUF3488 domain-containing transglutaminase family protein [Pseudomonadales bacterium]|nr:DUF3488 domain-containing transglutaminase family protein [Pseudomonadales bacterium]
MNDFQIPRNSLAWLLAAQVAVIAPHVGRLPVWVTLVCVGCFVWRVMVYQGRWSYPGRWSKALFVLGGMIGIPVGYGGRVYGLEPAVALLIVAFVLKLLEMHARRDAYIVILLAYFVAVTEFLFDQSIPYTLYILLTVAMITAGLIGLNQTRSHIAPMRTFRLAVTLLMQAVPLMIVLFVLFPRMTPLWSVPLQSQAAKTGVTDSMSPGDIANLTQSSELAFRVTFDGEPPPFNQLYWRGLVLGKYDGKTWSREELRPSIWRYRQAEPGWVDTIERLGNPVSYSVILEPTFQNWLFSLTISDIPEDRDVAMLREFNLAYIQRRGVTTKFRYELTSHLDHRLDAELSDFWRYRSTLLPPGGNPATRALAARMYASAGSPEAFVREVLTMFNTQSFVYTLQPDALGTDDIDGFLFDTRRGFCEHYAGSLVFMLRSVGIPARVVVGYQGGEYNPLGNYVAVRQFDAHAWSEVWFEGKGWVRVDPTMAVAPDRIERGLQAVAEEDETLLADSPLSWLQYRQLLWLTDLRLQLDAVGHYWDSWVVEYNTGTQQKFLQQLFGEVDKTRLGMIMLALFFSILLVIGAVLLLQRTTRILPPADQQYLRFCHLVARYGVERQRGEAPYAYLQRIEVVRPDLAEAAREVTRLYVEQTYGTVQDKAGQQSHTNIKKAVNAFRLKALTANV